MSSEIEFSPAYNLPDSLGGRPDLFDFLMQIPGESFRKVATRETLRIKLDGRSFFIKRHFGVGCVEVIKNWIVFKKPVVSALNEVEALHQFEKLGIPTTPYVAHGIEGIVPSRISSFVLTEDLGSIVTLEDLAIQWQVQRPKLSYKRAIIKRVAEIASLIHVNGIYHRDFYICHFCFKSDYVSMLPPQLHLIDLHRVEMRKKRSLSLQRKDLAALYFSADTMKLTTTDVHYFLQHYNKGFEAYQDQSLLNKEEFKEIALRANALLHKLNKKKAQGKAL